MWKLVEHDGKVAICLPWQTDYNRPVETQVTKVCDVAVGRWAPLLGREVKFTGNRGIVYNDYGQPTVMDTSAWETVIEERPVKPPRQKKDRPAWRWHYGRWVNY